MQPQNHRALLITQLLEQETDLWVLMPWFVLHVNPVNLTPRLS